MSPTAGRSDRLSKSRFVKGWQCHRLLWWAVNEPDAEELQLDPAERDRVDQGREVGVEARRRFPGGVLIDLPHDDPRRVAATAEALKSGAPAIFEATFVEDGVFAAVDVLERANGGFNLIEVKATTKVKDEHYPDVAVQAHVVRRAGIRLGRIELMHLNPEHRHPDRGELFVREELTPVLADYLDRVPAEIEAQREALRGPLPEVRTGQHCCDPDDCPFWDRCWPEVMGHVMELNRARGRDWKLLERGIERLVDIPAGERLTAIQERQREAARTGGLVVDVGLAEELAFLRGRIGFLDFETVQRALPWLTGLKPWAQVTAQFSYHEQQADGSYLHQEHLADGPGDPREGLARALLQATASADVVLMYHHFERDRIKELADALPHLAHDLLALAAKLVDLLPIVERTVYHPDFAGSFSIKTVLPVLVPGLPYDDLHIQEGGTAALELWRLLSSGDAIPPAECKRIRTDLLAYCQRDTWAMVKLVERLRELVA